ncbi:hypothetical protein NQ317_009480, partial [Molorchus minor]
NRETAEYTKEAIESTERYNTETTTKKTVENKTIYGSSDIQRFNFPHSLQIVNEVLKNLKNDVCVRDTTIGLEGMTRNKRWALEMFDSFPKFPVGILYGNYYELGNFDECIGVKHSVQEHGISTTIQGQYCLADIHFKNRQGSVGRFSRAVHDEKIKKNRSKFNNTVIHWGICLPSSCSTEDAGVFVREIFSSVVENFEVVSVTIEPNKCYYEHSSPITTLEVVYGCIIGIFVIFTLLATGHHYIYIRQRQSYLAYNIESIRTKKPSTFQEVVICFSYINTIGKFLHIKPNELNLECICGIKFISMTLIIVGHSLMFIIGGPVANKNFFDEMSIEVENGPFLNNVLLVDTFLLTSGFLMCRLLLLELDKRKRKTRYIRLTPAYIVVVGLYTTFFVPYWYRPFMAIKSRVGKRKMFKIMVGQYACMFQSWYLAVDYHMFIISPIIIYPLWNGKK